MAKQAGSILIRGSVSGACFYKMDGHYYVRAKSSLSGKRVKMDKAFVETMRNARLLAEASVIASAIYRRSPDKEKKVSDYRKLVGKVMKELKEETNTRSRS